MQELRPSLGVDVRRAFADEPERLVDLVYAFMHAEAAAARRVVLPAARRSGEATQPAVAAQHAGAAQLSGCQRALHLHICRHEPQRVGHHEPHVGAFGRALDRCRCFRRKRQGLFDQHVPSRVDGSQRDVGMRVVRSVDDYCVEVASVRFEERCQVAHVGPRTGRACGGAGRVRVHINGHRQCAPVGSGGSGGQGRPVASAPH